MRRKISRIRVTWLGLSSLASLTFVGGGSARADSLVLKDGRLISGQVSHTSSGYVVHTVAGDINFSDDQVQSWTRAQPGGAAGTTSAPASASRTPSIAAPGAPTPSSPSPPLTASAPRGRDRATIQKTVAVLLRRGDDALAAFDYRSARDAFADALALEPKDVKAAEGAGYAYLQLNNYARARDALEVAYAGSQPPSRSVACNLAVALSKTRNPMRAAKVLKEYMVSHPQPLDEPALNALAATLFSADESARRNAFFAQVASFYDDYNRKLEATRTGEKRWGSRWLSASEADKKLNTYYAKRSQIEALNRRAQIAKAAFNSAAQKTQDALADARFQKSARSRANAHKQEMATADREYQQAMKELGTAQTDYEQPPIDEALATVAPGPLVPAPSTPTAVASATPALAGPTGAALPTGATGTTAPPKPAPASPASLVAKSASVAAASPGGAPRPGTGAPAVLVAVRPAPPAATRTLHVQTDAVAFPVAPDLLVTTAEAADHATSISVQLPDGGAADAQVVAYDAGIGLALVRLKDKKLPYLALADAFGGGAVTSVGFPEVSLFDPVAAVIPGTATKRIPPAGGAGAVGGADARWTVHLARAPRLGGGPLLANGKVVGVQLANRDTDRTAVPFATLGDLKRLMATNLPSGAPAGGIAADPRTVTLQLTATKERE